MTEATLFSMKKSAIVGVTLLVITSLVLGGALTILLKRATASVVISKDPHAIFQQLPREKTLIVDIDGGRVVDPTNWNWLIPGVRRDQGYHQLILEQLFYVNLETGDYIPWVAEGYEYSPDYTSIKIYIRKGVTWSDGVPFTADDVVFTYQYLLKWAPKLAYSASVKAVVKSVRKIDNYTVEITFYEPYPRFHLNQEVFSVCRIWGGMQILPKHIFEKVEDPLKFKFYPPVGTGPYKLISASETMFIYERRDDWWGTKVFGIRPAPKYVVYVWYGPEETRAMRMAAHELDSICDITPGTFLKVRERNPYVKAWRTGMPWAWLDPCPRYLELTYTKYPWNIPEVRWAINLMIDRDEIVRVAYENSTYPSWICLPFYGPIMKYLKHPKVVEVLKKYEKEGLLVYDEELGHWKIPYNPEKAAELLKSLGFKKGADGIWVTPNGTRLELTLYVPAPWIEKRRIAAVLVPMLREQGIDIVQKIVEVSTFGEVLRAGTFDGILHWTCPGDTDPYFTMEQWHSKYWAPVGQPAPGTHTDNERYKNPEYDEIIDEWAKTPPTDFDKCAEIFAKALDVWLRDLPHGAMIAQARKLIPFDTYYWIGWPDETNPWIHPCNWWSTFLLVITGYPKPGTGEWVGGIRPRKIDYATVYFTKDTPKFRGIDLQWYGPFKAGDAARIPADDAEFWIAQGYASYKPPAVAAKIPGLEELTKAVSDLETTVSAVASDVETIKSQIAAISGQIGALAAVAALEAIVIIILAVLLLRKK